MVAFVVVVSVAVFNLNVAYDTRGLQEDNAELVMHVVVGFVVMMVIMSQGRFGLAPSPGFEFLATVYVTT